MSSLLIKPQIIQNICCPRCFYHYPLNSLNETYTWKETPQSRKCGERLWTRCLTRSGPKVIPHRLYTTQDFKSWLEFFLSYLGIEDLIDLSYQHHSLETKVMDDIWDSPVWHSMGSLMYSVQWDNRHCCRENKDFDWSQDTSGLVQILRWRFVQSKGWILQHFWQPMQFAFGLQERLRNLSQQDLTQ